MVTKSFTYGIMRGSAFALGLAALLWLLLASWLPAQATGVVTNCTEAGIDAALVSGGMISFNCNGTNDSATIVVSNSKTIVADTTIDGDSVITLSGGGNTRLFYVNAGVALTLSNITIAQGYSANDNGGAIRNHGTLNIINSKFFSNTTGSSWSGGAIETYGPLNISSSEFGYNTGGNGGAIYPRFSAAVTWITTTTFHDNRTTNNTSNMNGHGGAMLLWDGAPVTIQNSSFSKNIAEVGGAIYVYPNSSLILNNSLINGNASATDGGGIYNKGTAIMINSTLSGNPVC